MNYDKTDSSTTTEFTTYVANPPPMPGQELKAVVDSNGGLLITLNDPVAGSFAWNGVLAAAPVIYDILGAVIADQFGNLDPEEG